MKLLLVFLICFGTLNSFGEVGEALEPELIPNEKGISPRLNEITETNDSGIAPANSETGMVTNKISSKDLEKESLYQLSQKDHKALPVESSLLTVGARIDVGFSAGTEVYQGFTVPAIRLNATGSHGKYVEYGLSLGPTREFSTALLPQLLPVEAYLAFKAPVNDYGTLRCTVGMFNPTENPWWTPDLATVPLPDYHTTHRMVLLDNDVGVELSYQPMDGMVKISFGFFNGNGIFNLNTNNSKAFTGSIALQGDWGNSKVQLGLGTHSMEQSTLGSVNYKSSWAFDVFASIASGPLLIGVDSFVAGVQDNFRSLSPRGSAGFLHYSIFDGFGLFGRVEGMSQTTINGGSLTTWQVGPKVQIGQPFQGFFFYEYYRTTGSRAISSGQVRLRFSL